MTARQVQSGLLQGAARNASKSWHQFLRSKTPDGRFQLLGAYGTFFDRQKLENR
jgi:hypothetical protein